MGVFIDLSGRKFGRLRVLGPAESTLTTGCNIVKRWYVKCDCGVEKIVRGGPLRNGETRSCGCIFREMIVARNLARIVHGQSSKLTLSREYRSWTAMIRRCCNKNDKDYNNYGGRGIEVCEEWRASFVVFLSNMGKKPSIKHTIDRINNDGHYEPGNCRWATIETQSCNKRTNKYYAYNGIQMVQDHWAKKLGISSFTIKYWIDRGHPFEFIVERFSQSLRAQA